ncbi:P-loop NTPase family protein [Mycolicibacterium brisbanense]|uniref:Uncharacterized protein n=1 Tax=Mycolicibacterium brisbanense TaxID=146020 RepID=A0A100VUK7_9MYCO|nr:hypothetical protein [Mycolicibacterium brisbanense]MCV7156258.1 hypothetical protein [Mycolicibacterium brisbanense]GAS86348.1 uncharacterized protein RMCB_0444 [Mycolicibacterium brisbanense]
MKIECTGSYIELEEPVIFKYGDKIRFEADAVDEGQVYLHLFRDGKQEATIEFSSLRAHQLGRLLKKAAIGAAR